MEDLLAARADRLYASDIRALVKYTSSADVISFGVGLPAPDLFPTERISMAFKEVLTQASAQALQYGQSEGYRPLREYLAGRITERETTVQTDEVLITTGSQQGLDLIGKVFLDPGDKVVAEKPTYLGAIQTFSTYQVDFVGVSTSDDGIDTDELEEILKRHEVKLIYICPNFQNPSGQTTSLVRRQRLVRLAEQHNALIVEDDSYRELRYDGTDIPSLRSLDKNKRVIELGTFSKVLVPGLRVGWMVADRRPLSTLILAKQAADLHTSVLAQMVLLRVCNDGYLDRHIGLLRPAYRKRRDALLSSLKDYLPTEIRWNKPEGGLFVFVELPDRMDAKEMLVDAIQSGVTYAPGHQFFVDGTGRNTLRLNFSCLPAEQISLGVQRLASVMSHYAQSR